MNAKQFLKTLDAVRPGEWIMYHFGFLMADRCVEKGIELLARAVWGAQKDGLITLVQRRGDGGCSYYAVKL